MILVPMGSNRVPSPVRQLTSQSSEIYHVTVEESQGPNN
jgi:hypothetical protein